MSQEQDKKFFRNFSLTLALIAAMMIAFYIIADAAVKSKFGLAKNEKDTDKTVTVAELTKPVGQVSVVSEESKNQDIQNAVVANTPESDSNGNNGESVYSGLCVNCHGIAALAAMIPQTGDAAAWESRVAKGIDALYENAINGYTGELGMMPAKGGNPALSDDEVKTAVDYILSQIK